eukprot:CAMPEP_0119530562 /NCGR_PEP_ID=MMETSP1344-20130328/44395_1 /TAXON_ID=236787 /ORGANISM="Florenciella parvula, Strain CCMP2471" /LENGTH=50 /DNA_ID=CAMNT_0007570551 /DNA_START=8 /DNA_END=157 /DNA_ORIENTATION=+
MNHKQAVILRGSSLSGRWRIGFNGQHTSWLSAYTEAADVYTAMMALDTIG